MNILLSKILLNDLVLTTLRSGAGAGARARFRAGVVAIRSGMAAILGIAITAVLLAAAAGIFSVT